MIRILLPLLAGLICALHLPAQSKISRDGRIFLQKYRSERVATLQAMGLDADAEPTVAVIALLAPGYTADDVASAGYEVANDMNVSVIVHLPVSEIETMAELPCIQSVTFGGRKRALMDLSRAGTGVDAVHSGIDIKGEIRTFSGAGVIVGMMDNGFEANHLNFLDDTGKSRIEQLWHYPNSKISSVKTYNKLNISSFKYDTNEDAHATHVAGILTGSYSGTGNYAYTASAAATSSTQRKNQAMPYGGVAPGATPVFAVGELYDGNILDGVDRIVKYAKAEGRPAVVNLSLGSNIGSHDETDEMTATLNELGKDAIICVAAGNEADMDMSLSYTFTDGDTSFSTFIDPASDYGSTTIDKNIDIWSSDSRPLVVTLSTYRIIDGKTTLVASRSSVGESSFSNKTGMSSGSGWIISEVKNNRYNTYIYPQSEISINSSYRLMIKVTGSAGQKINMYYGGYGHFRSHDVEGFTDGSADESINSMATAPNLLAIGSYCSRSSFGVLGDSYLYRMSYDTPGQVSSFSSYGTMPDGTRMPIVLAPGSTVISSFNRYYVEGTAGSLYGETPEYMTGSAKNGSQTDYWGAMDGTSMACPFAAGVIALWLEADPTLNVDDIKDIIAKTSTTDSHTAAKPAAAGYGKIDAAAGLRYILTGNASIGAVTDRPEERLLIEQQPDALAVTMGGESTFTATLYDLQGRAVGSAEGRDSSATIPTVALSKGIYVLTISGSGSTTSRKILLQ